MMFDFNMNNYDILALALYYKVFTELNRDND